MSQIAKFWKWLLLALGLRAEDSVQEAEEAKPNFESDIREHVKLPDDFEAEAEQSSLASSLDAPRDTGDQTPAAAREATGLRVTRWNC